MPSKLVHWRHTNNKLLFFPGTGSFMWILTILDPKSKFALQYSETVKQFFLLLISWVWMTKSHVSDAKPQTRTNKATNTSAVASSSGESSISHKKEREAIEGPKPNQVSSGASTGKIVLLVPVVSGLLNCFDSPREITTDNISWTTLSVSFFPVCW